MDIPEMVTINEASKRTGLSYDFIRKGCLKHEIVHVRAGKKYFINLPKLVELLNTNK